MRKVKHNKIRNTGLLYEFLLRQVTLDVLNDNNSRAVKIIKKRFNENTELGKELALYNIVVNSNKTTYKEVAKKFSSAGYKDLRPVHVALVKRAISTNSKHRYINNLPLFGK